MTAITQRELSNDTGRVLDELPANGRTIITRRGVPVAVILPVDVEALYDHLLANVPDYVQAMSDVDTRLAKAEPLDGITADELEAELGIAN